MTTRHFCLFLKKRETRSQHRVVQHGTCVFCPTKLSRYNGKEACFSCQEKLRDTQLEYEGNLAIAEEEGIEINFLKENVQQRGKGVQATFWRECRGTCEGNGQTVFGVIDPISQNIRLEQTRAISRDGTCGACGGKIMLFRNSIPYWAEHFRVHI